MATQKIDLYKDFAIGYQLNALGKSKFRTLATVPDSITLDRGTYHLAASNGLGKTTLLKTLTKLIPPNRDGFNITGSLQCLFDNLSWENELTGADILAAFKDSLDENCVHKLADEIDVDLMQSYEVLSRGQRQKINILMVEGRAALHEDAVILYDEPLSGMDLQSVEKIANHWHATEKNVLRLFSEHLKHPAVQISGTMEIRDQKIVMASK